MVLSNGVVRLKTSSWTGVPVLADDGLMRGDFFQLWNPGCFTTFLAGLAKVCLAVPS